MRTLVKFNYLKIRNTVSLILFSLLQSTATHRPNLRHNTRSADLCLQSRPTYFFRSSVHVTGGRPLLYLDAVTTLTLVCSKGYQIFERYGDFSLFIVRAMSITLILWRITSVLSLSLKETPSIGPAIAYWLILPWVYSS